MDDFMRELIDHYVEEKLQKCSYIIGDVLNAHGRESFVFMLVTMQNLVDSVLPRLSESEQELFKILHERSVVLTFPSEMDPRKRDGK